jgi:NADH dehydrogenase [ubiquinone] 1 alpha subcomplex assembly factor 2
VREQAPTIDEQQNELLRQERMKHLARLADEKWARKPSFLDRPQEQQPAPATQTHPITHTAPDTRPEPVGVRSAVGTEAELKQQGTKGKKPSPWDIQTGTPGEKWQPKAWTPTPAKK